MNKIIKKITTIEATDICSWKYPKPYDIYNLSIDSVEDLLDPTNHYHVIYDQNVLVGFFCYGEDAQVPGYQYDKKYKDIGLGMKPNMAGKRNGDKFVRAIIKFLYEILGFTHLRLTVAEFNQRAISVYKKVGFSLEGSFINPKSNLGFCIMKHNYLVT